MNDSYVTLPFNTGNDNAYGNKLNSYTTALIHDLNTENCEIGLTELHLLTNRLAYFSEKECEITVVELIMNRGPYGADTRARLDQMVEECRKRPFYIRNPHIKFRVDRTTVSVYAKIQLDPFKVSESFDSFFTELKEKLRNEPLSEGYPIEKFDPRTPPDEEQGSFYISAIRPGANYTKVFFDTNLAENYEYVNLKGEIGEQFQNNTITLNISMKLAAALDLGVDIAPPLSSLDEDQNDGRLPEDTLLMCVLPVLKESANYALYDQTVTTKNTRFSNDLVHVCSNVIEQSNFGNSSTNLLRSVMIEKGPNGVNQSIVFPNTHYVRASSNVTRFINIKLLNNERKPYEINGEVSMAVKLHVKPVSI